MSTDQKTIQRKRRHARIRSKVSGTSDIPRLVVYRSNTTIYAQIIDDEKGNTLLSINDSSIKSGTKTEKSYKAGEEIAKIAKDKKIEKVVFDRGGYLFLGRVKAFAEGARKGGLKF